MPIPDFQTLMRPLLELLEDGAERPIQDVTAALADRFEITDAERSQKLPSGQQSVFSNRVAWAKAHLKMAGLVANPRRGIIAIAHDGSRLLKESTEPINLRVLNQLSAYRRAKEGWGVEPAPDSSGDGDLSKESTPLEVIEQAAEALRAALATDILQRLGECHPDHFERIVVQLLVAMGYGGSLADAGQRIGRSGDGGVDGIIKEDRLGQDTVCIQAKRWKDTVGRPIVQAFVGSLDYHRSRKGVLITTSSYSRDALEYVDRVEGKKIVLIDGRSLADYMIDFNVGVTNAQTFVIRRVDDDFFLDGADSLG